MTAQAERIKAAHRGWRQAEPASRSRLAALDTFGLRYVAVDDFNVIVEGEYQLNIAMSYWRSNDGSAQGYLVSTLDAEIKRNSEKPATGRDSDEAGRTASKTVASANIAESVAGSHSPDSGSASLLPMVSP